MSKKKRKPKSKRKSQDLKLDMKSWLDDEGIHVIVPGSPATPEMLERMTERYQEEIRRSPLWDKMVKEFGEPKAEEFLKGFRVKKG